MCGIAGFINQNQYESKFERTMLLNKMCRIITYRGPDEQGTMVEGRAALGMRRLSIIDLKSGQQPIYNETGDLAIVFNGEIYNFRELKRELESLGHTFKTNSDTETIVHAYEQFGAKCVDKLRGMFAFAIWDEKRESLFIARDRIGKKPLFYAVTKNGDFVFGSEIKVLLAHGDIDKTLDLNALDAYLTFGYVPEEMCIFKHINKLPPAHHLEYANGAVKIERYWDFQFDADNDSKSLDEKDYIETLREKLDDAVKVRLVSEVPLGAFLSGGVDSSAIVALMSRHVSKVKTFSIGFNEDSYDELKFARIAAKHFDTEHHEFVVTPDLVDVIDDLVWHFDEPFADSSSLPTFMVAKMARDFVTVVLSGDGGDELFAGYTRYAIDKKRGGLANMPKFIREKLMIPLAANLPHGARGRNYLRNVALEPVERYIDSVSQFSALNRQSLYSKDFRQTLNGAFGAGEKLFAEIANAQSDALEKLLYLDGRTYLPSDILTKVDRMTMAASLEARAPLLDHELIEFVGKIPAALKLKGLTTKHIFKQALTGIVPDEILHRKKQGFGVPIDVWINNQLRERISETLLESRTLERGMFDAKYIKTLLDEHSKKRRDNSHALWELFVLELWQRRHLD
ncbi:MAG: asparagine synthase (glutamine-hydrolyzing) [Pyrinomonadaceae bacterium]|nr:asparagine synthase (glutamine-hydrolyzing) [Pyrinomonadaceae bacterium]